LARRRAARLFQGDPDAVASLVVALVAIHDIGKFAASFQDKRRDLFPSVLFPVPPGAPTTYHTEDGFAVWGADLAERIGPRLWDGDPWNLNVIVQAVLGHHGRPIGKSRRGDVRRTFQVAAIDAARQFTDIATRLLVAGPFDARDLDEKAAQRATWWVAGLVTASDWIGSNEAWFPYTSPIDGDDSLRAYWALARQRAEIAVRAAGMESPRPALHRSFAELSGRSAAPTSVQQWAQEVAISREPTLFVIEDATGSGKTEAAQIIIHRLMAAEQASGAFWAMPTQATANAMYQRHAERIRVLFADDCPQQPSLVLAHAQSRMHDGFRETVIDLPLEARHASEVDEADAPSEVTCAAFLANSSRTALLADVGAGTVDQAILSVLPSKFNTMRLFGLSDKVLVLDEIHAYDAYMVAELEALLRFHAQLGGSAIALSATLPAALLVKLTDAWRSGASPLPVRSSARPLSAAYPLATTVTGGDFNQTSLTPTPWSRRSVPVRLVQDEETAIEGLLDASARGCACVWIRNTVDSCREAAAALRARGARDVSVFHARFAQVDRQDRERDVLERFAAGDRPRRAGAILVATQVVEQSLDIDFDVMISDLAPIDLLIQRCGRLWRHPSRQRPMTEAERQLLVLSPEFSDDPGPSWLDGVLPKTKWVYPDPGILWRTLRVLHDRMSIDAPDGLRDLIEQVYDDDFCPDRLVAGADRASGDAFAAAGSAKQYVLSAERGYLGDDLIWSSDTRVPTRLGNHQVTVRIGRVEGGHLRPWADERDGLPDWHRWALSEIRVARHRVPRDAMVAAELAAAANAARGTWGKWEQEIPLLPLVREGDGWRGQLRGSDGELAEFQYDRTDGMRFVG
jgi:CRISPR-associated endonuclease/helicase Cas3